MALSRCALFCTLIFSSITLSLRADIVDHWHWRNPSPFSDTLHSICFGAGKFVAVGDGGVIHTSPDGVTWDDGQRPVTSTLRKVIFANGQFVAVGDYSAIAVSSDGNSWTSVNLGTTGTLYSVTYGNGVYVACGQQGLLLVSTNGLNWSVHNQGIADLNWITFGNGVFVLPTPNQQMAVQVSSDLQTWITESIPSVVHEWPHYLFQAEFGNGKFVAAVQDETLVGANIYQPDGHFYFSSDGTNWTQGAEGGAISNDFHFFTFAGGAFYDFAAQSGFSSELLYSTIDGTTANYSITPTTVEDGAALGIANGTYVMLGSAAEIWTSTDTTNWTAQFGGNRASFDDVIRGAGNYVALEDSQPVLISSDGVTFSPATNSPTGLGAVAFDGTNYVGVGGPQVYTSADAQNWVQRTSNTTKGLRAICRGPNGWVAVGASGTVINSPSALTWTLRSSGTANNLNGAVFGNGTYVAVGDSGTVISSSDGNNWNVQFGGTTENLSHVQFLNAQFIAVGAGGTIVTSPDGSNWSATTLSPNQTLSDVSYGDGHYVVCGSDSVAMNVLLWSTDATNWSDITTKLPTSAGLSRVLFLNGSFWLCGANGTLLQSDSLDGIPRLSGAMLPGTTAFQLKVLLNAPSNYRVQVATNLQLPNSFQDLANVTNATAWTDTNASAWPVRFYRIVSP